MKKIFFSMCFTLLIFGCGGDSDNLPPLHNIGDENWIDPYLPSSSSLSSSSVSSSSSLLSSSSSSSINSSGENGMYCWYNDVVCYSLTSVSAETCASIGGSIVSSCPGYAACRISNYCYDPYPTASCTAAGGTVVSSCD